MADSVDASRAGARLTIDLGAIRDNYRLLAGKTRGACAAVMKADAYGLGMEQVAPALALEGCRVFFTAHLDEGIRLRQLVPDGCAIYVLHGPPPGTATDFFQYDLRPVLNDPSQVQEWRQLARKLGRMLPAAIQVDTGMSRMGIAPGDLMALSGEKDWLAGIEPTLVMSHLACADEPGHPLNDTQRRRFDSMRELFPGVPASLANSSGVFLGSSFHYDLLRPGAALYGINPQPGMENPLKQAVSLHARIVQVRTVREGDVVGYGAYHLVPSERRIATVAVGYADGWQRTLSGRGFAFVDGVVAPFVGRVSMDSITLDVTGIAPERVVPGADVELMGEHQPVDEVAALSGTIGYEVLTRLGSRFHRRYV
ncbi:alanine racemase [Massilia sp. IC2-476]|uniref:alanine racemase n=1 Tax=Massilia sp. IC2-476 TaxID=2887199 RepID=UPI001D107A05|nr:alanine racemase [Massilia sp. IC2-476]MCC2971556.1 alanine racemase [Massilia sp. IC2-476]